MKTVFLYKGDNGCQDFYQSEDGKVLLLRVKGESFWRIYSNGWVVNKRTKLGFSVVGSKIFERAVELAENHFKCAIKIDESKSWRFSESSSKMVLTTQTEVL